ncbi:Flp family type IVb pilin [Sphingopyxis sp. XHP0097]|uniref:Flp family type IVb pilin n=1 Tax=Sphingopyxis jiangsuensis TaxID=2871171 RepID=A0ABS7ME39_9SPHN|nr:MULTISPECIES: Flp family type IVb pilin [Sphingopyxis]MBL0769584.1 Flp family type IVb pilin [Sphingopyxis lutea]MBY4637287.1 Flp family type IVb pilin [Sphingopyxis jiangsuensis]
MKSFLKDFIRDDSGASAAEYALILAIVGTGIAAAAFALGGSISGAMTTAKTCIDSAGGTTTPNC